MKIIVYTGSFNPLTKGHVLTMESAINAIDADKGMFVMTPGKYLNRKMYIKNKSSFVLSEDTREQMITSICNDNNKFQFGGKELGSSSPSTVKTLNSIQKKNRDAKLYLLFGADKLRNFPRWDSADEIIDKYGVIIATRKDFNINEVIDNDEFLTKHKDKFIIIYPDQEALNISSTDVRERFLNSEDYSTLVPEEVNNILNKFSTDQFNEPTEEEMIKYHLTCNGRYGGQNARLLVFKSNEKIFKKWDKNLLGDKESKLNNTKVYKNQFTTNYNFNYDTVYECVNKDCADVAEEMLNDNYNPVILNLASNVSPGGGYHKGTNAQEECLCQMSTLSQSLYQYGSEKYKHIRDAELPKYYPDVYPMDINYGGIYSPDVVFFRNNKSQYYSLRDKTFSTSVITIASLSNREKNSYTNDERKYFNDDLTLTDEGISIEKNKIRTIFRIALDNGHDSIVLGAFGCGVYNLLPSEVSKLFYDVLNETEFKNNFKKVTFAILERKGKNGNKIGPDGKFKPVYDLFS